ncbi:helix-turn-helix transcriptional regulator [Clostridium botulinum]|uniref:helix-turn-helix domain-containing protein n=1 Tax=Clostridium TaxID=1485 RepID=UPI0013C9A4B3|nr:helix-turn-helix transcriptional regulator [Clostridium sporogenes]EKO1913208.1 helix-turn-helix transcriptional regulator [Clostridium botulinum]EKO2043270.1 helix-turn-helix transcriptional regulator [Clostridium botulinum]MCW6073846.1 helix-turn-helix transcriptional regulator [Clostridium sporogenes]MDS1008129.1 helix-turn-helix transcriptional regulator [Clostridium sporogenes]MDU1320766.1 helix-turn-helix transcriptional regulator [Clostridium botulinum]
MAFSNKLYSLRKQKGLSQDELGSKLNVSRQTISKWELGETTPELEKLIALGDFFEISLDELVMDIKAKESTKTEPLVMNRLETIINSIDRENVKMYTKKISKIVLIIMVIILAIDLISMIVYFILNGFPI